MPCSQNLINADGNLYSYSSPFIGVELILFPRINVVPIYYVFIRDLPDFGMPFLPMLFSVPELPAVVGFVCYAVLLRTFAESSAFGHCAFFTYSVVSWPSPPSACVYQKSVLRQEKSCYRYSKMQYLLCEMRSFVVSAIPPV